MKARWPALLASLLATPLYAQGAPDLALGAVVVSGGRIEVSVINRGDAPSYGCYLELALFDAAGRRADSRRQTLKPLPPGDRQEVSFPTEPTFSGKRFQITVDSSNRVPESDEDNNASEMVDAPVTGAPPIRIPGAQQGGGGRPAPIRIGPPPTGSHVKPPIKIPGKDPAQLQVDLVAVKVADNGIEATGIVRNDGAVEFTGRRTARLTRETRGSSHVLEQLTIAEQEVPLLAPGQTWEMKVKSPKKVKGARSYTYFLNLEPNDHHGDNDYVTKMVKVVAID